MPRLETRIKVLERSGNVSRLLTVKMFPPPEDKLQTTQEEYRYEFTGPPRQRDDQVIQLMIKVIQFLNKRHMLFAAANVWPHALDTSPPLWPGRAKGANKLYAFTQAFEEFPLAAEVTILRGALELTPGKVFVRRKGQGQDGHQQPWTPLIHWLLQLPDPDRLTTGVTRRGVPRMLHCQQVWWQKTGMCFPLLRLPAELRALVYRHALGENIYPHTRYDQSLGTEKLTLGSIYYNVPIEQGRQPAIAARSDPPNYEILALSKSIRKEALKAVWVGTWKHFVRPSYFADALGANVIPLTYAWLTRLHLNFSSEDYFSFFGVSIDPNVSLSPANSKGQLLSNISELRHLELSFRKPYDIHRNRNPWSTFRDHNRHHTWFQVDQKYRSMPSIPCQKVMVDWILTFAFPFIRNIPNVYLVGAVKRVTKQKWDYILAREYAGRKFDDCSHGFEHARELAALLGRQPYESVNNYGPNPYAC